MVLEQLRRLLGANTSNARNVVAAVPGEREGVSNLRRWDAHLLLDGGGVVAVVAHRLEQTDAVVHELHQVLVTGDDLDLPTVRDCLLRQRRDDVVGFHPRDVELLDAKAIDDLMDARDLGGHVLRRRWPRGLVVGVDVFAEVRPATVERDRQILGLFFAEQLLDHRREAHDRVGRFAFGGAERSNRVIRPEDVSGAVDDV